ncbi:hypothetical protein [Paenibacillus agricola]|uniref:Uncharacterized protein n=1 Tax=Paenibacillus agricola TaxID=2716264 RepID=A0ABX0JHF1_9BACL|nr:hypothetical protein [Paenibacillus agricola]NHN33135.1 hypothetical protein [Paenibacillus agricola]
MKEVLHCNIDIGYSDKLNHTKGCCYVVLEIFEGGFVIENDNGKKRKIYLERIGGKDKEFSLLKKHFLLTLFV